MDLNTVLDDGRGRAATDIERRTQQLIEARKSESLDIHIAVVRKMISIIRNEVQGDFAGIQ